MVHPAAKRAMRRPRDMVLCWCAEMSKVRESAGKTVSGSWARKRAGTQAMLAAAAAVIWVASGCGPHQSDGERRVGPPPARSTARPDLVETLKKDLRAVRHPADGGGAVRLVVEESVGNLGQLDAGNAADAAAPDPNATVSTPGRWTFLYTAGPLGISEGGMLLFQAPPFWGWSPPQTDEENAPGFTVVTTDAQGVELRAEAAGDGLLGIRIGGRGLAAGERVRIVYGAGPQGATADRFAERDSVFWFSVDGDGDGVRALVADPPAIDVRAGPPVRMLLTVPTTAHPGDVVAVHVAFVDRAGNVATSATGDVTFVDPPDGLDLPEHVRVASLNRGCKTAFVTARAEGTYRLRARGPGGLEAESNPLVVSEHGPRILWADLHGHSRLSDGTGTPHDYFKYARDVAGLDIAALTDHDHWGMQFLDRNPPMWNEIVEAARAFDRPGTFVALPGYEWTSWTYGHRHVVFFSGGGEVLSSLDDATDTPAELWRALRGRRVLTIAHHSAGGPIAIDWSVAPDPHLEPATEVVSVHGSSEAADAPDRIYSAVEGNFVRDALARGYRLGFLGSGDTHDGHPGLGHLAALTGGVTAVVSETLTREAVLAAIHYRRTYATSGPRILLRAALDSAPMGATTGGGDRVLFVRAVGTAPLERFDVVRTGSVVARLDCRGSLDCTATHSLAGLAGGEYVYVRVLQRDGAAAWSSPIFIEGRPSSLAR